MTKTVTRKVTKPSPMGDYLLRYLYLGNQEKQLRSIRDKVKRSLMDFVEQYHEEDPDKGHLLNTLPEPVELDGVTYSGFMKQRKTSQVFLEDEAEHLCLRKGFDYDDYTSRYVDQDKIVRLYAEDRISKEEFDTLFETNVSWAFVPVKA